MTRVARFASLRTMKFLVPALALMLFAGCHTEMAMHRKDFSPSKPKGPWNDYRNAVRKGEKYEPPKELKDR